MKQSSTPYRSFLVLVLLSSLSLVEWMPAPLRVALGFFQFYYLPGLVLLLFIGDLRRPHADDLVLPLVLSPALLSMLIIVAHWVTSSLDAAVRAALILLNVALAVALLMKRGNGRRSSDGVPVGVHWISLAFAGVIAGAFMFNTYLLVYSDAWHHASIIREIMDRGVPPREPRFADMPLRYMWFYHLFQAAWTQFTRLPLFPAIAVANVTSAIAFPYLIARATGFLTSERRAIVGTALISIAGAGSAAWILWPVVFVRALSGDVTGIEEVTRILKDMNWNGAQVNLALTPYGTHLLNVVHKFLTITAINCSVNLLLLSFVLYLDRDYQGRSRMRAAAMMFFLILGTFLFHIVTGTVLILTVCGAAVLLFLVAKVRDRSWPPAFQTFVIPGAAVLAGAIATPYFLSLTRGGAEQQVVRDHLYFGTTNMLTIILPLIVLLPFSWAALRRVFTSSEPSFRALAAWIVPLAGIALFIDLPGMAERKFALYLFYILTLPIALEIVRGVSAAAGVRRFALLTWFTLLLAVPVALTVRGYLLERPIKTFRLKRYVISGDEKRVFDWIRDTTEPDAVIIEANTYNLMPVRARRRSFYPDSGVIEINGFGGKKVERYDAIRKNLFRAEPIRGDTVAYLRKMGMSVYVVLWTEDEAPYRVEKLDGHPEWFERVFQNPAGIVYRLRP